MSIRMYRMACLACLKRWGTTRREKVCPFCGSDRIYDTGEREK